MNQNFMPTLQRNLKSKYQKYSIMDSSSDFVGAYIKYMKRRDEVIWSTPKEVLEALPVIVHLLDFIV